MKRALLIIGALVVLALGAQAQIGVGSGMTLLTSGVGGWTNSIEPSQTCTVTDSIIDVPRQKELCIQIKAELSDSGTTACGFTLQNSVDRSNWKNMAAVAWTPAGTSAVTTVTNFTVNATPYVRLNTIVNGANTGNITNYTVKIFSK
jgi:hypothetical protein